MPNHNILPQQPNQPPRRPRRPWGCVALTGAGMLAAAGTGLYWLAGGFDSEKSPNSNTWGGDSSASASATPGNEVSLPPLTSAPATEKPSPTPSKASPTPEASPTKTAPAELPDPYKATRHILTERYNRCGYEFTTSGGDTLNLDLSADYGRSPASVALWDAGQTKDLKFNKPQVVLARINDEGVPIKESIIDDAEENYRGTDDPLSAVVNLPSNVKDGTSYGVFLATEARTPYDGYTKATFTATYCGAVAFNEPGNDPGWRPTDAIDFVKPIYTDDFTVN